MMTKADNPYRGPQQTAGIFEMRDGDFRRERAAIGTSFMNSGWSGNSDATELAKKLIAEGMFGLVRQELEKTPLARLGSALVAPALRGVAKRIDYTEIGGALLAGVARPAVIAHGRSDANAIASAIRAAAQFAERLLPEQLGAALHALP